MISLVPGMVRVLEFGRIPENIRNYFPDHLIDDEETRNLFKPFGFLWWMAHNMTGPFMVVAITGSVQYFQVSSDRDAVILKMFFEGITDTTGEVRQMPNDWFYWPKIYAPSLEDMTPVTEWLTKHPCPIIPCERYIRESANRLRS